MNDVLEKELLSKVKIEVNEKLDHENLNILKNKLIEISNNNQDCELDLNKTENINTCFIQLIIASKISLNSGFRELYFKNIPEKLSEYFIELGLSNLLLIEDKVNA